mmetsp:Transcript_7304/g.22279  ORF Transcript_7304/g.22279 Transcript_7304/m.22279 type:complete len:205 (+) Transcript_7304:315-929(+)
MSACMASSSSLCFCRTSALRPGLPLATTFSSVLLMRFFRLTTSTQSTFSSPEAAAEPCPSAGASRLSLTVSSYSSSSKSCAPSRRKVPCRVSLARTFTFFGSCWGGTSIRKAPSSLGVKGGSSFSSAKSAFTSNGPVLRKDRSFRMFMEELAGKTSAVLYSPSPAATGVSPSSRLAVVASAALPVHPIVMGNGTKSSTLKSRTL